MHKVFGTKENEKYVDRKGAYIIPIKGDEIVVVETPKGFYLLGGGLDPCDSMNKERLFTVFLRNWINNHYI